MSKKPDRIKLAIHVISLTPLVLLVGSYLLGLLKPDPFSRVILRTGIYTVVFLLLSMVPTAVKILTGSGVLLKNHRTLGMYAFMYAVLHLLAITWFSYNFKFKFFLPSLVSGWLGLSGITSFILIIFLAITSDKAWIKRMGKRWRLWHGLAYLANILAVLHYLWSNKHPTFGSITAAVSLTCLLLLQLPPLKKYLARQRKKAT